MTSAGNNDVEKEKEKTNDDQGGLKFGADTAYDSDSEYVSALPTEEEERRLLAGENVRAREEIEDLDEGRVGSHPSTLAATNKASSAAREVSATNIVVVTSERHREQYRYIFN